MEMSTNGEAPGGGGGLTRGFAGRGGRNPAGGGLLGLALPSDRIILPTEAECQLLRVNELSAGGEPAMVIDVVPPLRPVASPARNL